MRVSRIALWAAFLVSLGVAVTWRDTDFGPYVRYAPPVLLVLALIVSLVEWIGKRRRA
jgi:hypothetical protein